MTTGSHHETSAGTDPRTAHRRAWDAIPWTVAGTAPAEEAMFVREHVQGCSDCRLELDFHQQLQAGLQSLEAPLANDEASRTEAALRQLWARADLEAAGLPAQDQLQQAPRARSWTRALVAAVVLQAVALGLAGGAIWGGHEGDYRGYSSAPGAGTVPSTIRYVPDPKLSLQTVRGQWQRAQLRAVEVMADGAVFGLAPIPGATLSSAQALQSLRRESGVLLAEPVAASAAASL